MTSEHVVFHKKPDAQYMIAGWRPQWSDGGEISSGLPQHLIDKFAATKIGDLGNTVSIMCYPFQVPGTHDAFRPGVSFQEGLPAKEMYRQNSFYDVGKGLIIFLGEEPWFRIDLYAEAFFQVARELGIKQTAAVEGYNGPAPPDLERSVNCSYSKPHMRDQIERYGVRFSNYGSEGRSGPTIAMALITLAHYEYQDIEMFRLGAMAPMYSFLTAKNEHLTISKDHRSFYDIMRRLNGLLKLDIDISDLKNMGDAESERLRQALDKIAASNATAREMIEKARADYKFIPYEEPVELTPELDRELDDIIKNMPKDPEQ